MVDSQERFPSQGCAIWAIDNKLPSQYNKYVNFVESDTDMKLRLATS